MTNHYYFEIRATTNEGHDYSADVVAGSLPVAFAAWLGHYEWGSYAEEFTLDEFRAYVTNIEVTQRHLKSEFPAGRVDPYGPRPAMGPPLRFEVRGRGDQNPDIDGPLFAAIRHLERAAW